jgi:hypothetical protein
MSIFDIDELKRSPGRKLILQHYRGSEPEIWPVEEAQITIGNRLMIKVPGTGYATDDYALADGACIRDRDGNLVGVLEFASEEITLKEFAQRLYSMPVDDSLDFTCSLENSCCFGAKKIRVFDSTLVIIAAYGGNESFLHDLSNTVNADSLCEELQCGLSGHLDENQYIYIDRHPKTPQSEKTETFQERIDKLRYELIQSIVKILKENGLTELILSEKLTNPTFVIWHNPQDEVFYDTPVSSVSIYGDGIRLEVEEPEYGYVETLYSVHGDEEFENILSRGFHDERDYLSELMENARYTGNDWHCAYNIGLTEAPAIGQGAVYPEEDKDFDGAPTDYENLWYFPGYMIKSYLEVLEKDGKVIFTGHRDNICNKRKTA